MMDWIIYGLSRLAKAQEEEVFFYAIHFLKLDLIRLAVIELSKNMFKIYGS